MDGTIQEMAHAQSFNVVKAAKKSQELTPKTDINT
jgi:hypothetical protein